MSHSLQILSDQVKFYKQELMNCEAQKQYHLKNLKAANEQQIKIQEVIDDLYKTIDRLGKEE